MDLVSLEEAKRQLAIEDDRTDLDIEVADKVEQASWIIMDYLKIEMPEEDSPSMSPLSVDIWPLGVPPNIKAATLLVLSELFESRQSSEANVLSSAVLSLLHRRRDPAMA